MNLAAVTAVLDALRDAGIPHWVAGGWGVDALVGHQTRRHRDLDLAVDDRSLKACEAALLALGYSLETDWLPVRAEFAGADGWVDVHPLEGYEPRPHDLNDIALLHGLGA